MDILITIKDGNVEIFDGGKRLLSEISDWIGNTKEEILLEYKSSKKKGGEMFE